MFGGGGIKSDQKIKILLKTVQKKGILHKDFGTFMTTLLSTITMVAFITKVTDIYMDPMATLVPQLLLLLTLLLIFAFHVCLGYQVKNAPMAILLPCLRKLLMFTVYYGFKSAISFSLCGHFISRHFLRVSFSVGTVTILWARQYDASSIGN
jgi:hypothetical protein